MTLLVGDSLGDGHEHVFQVDFFLTEHAEAKAILDQYVGYEGAVVDVVVESDPQRVVLARFDLEDAGMAFELFAGSLGHAVGHGHVEYRMLANAADGRMDVAVEQELAALDDAEFVPDIGEPGKDV